MVHVNPGQQGELLIPVQKPSLEAQAAWFSARCSIPGKAEACPALTRRPITVAKSVDVENFIVCFRAFRNQCEWTKVAPSYLDLRLGGNLMMSNALINVSRGLYILWVSNLCRLHSGLEIGFLTITLSYHRVFELQNSIRTVDATHNRKSKW